MADFEIGDLEVKDRTPKWAIDDMPVSVPPRLPNNPRMPADCGTSALGLLMQLGSGLFLCVGVFLVFFSLMGLFQIGLTVFFQIGPNIFWVILLVVMAIVRSGIHFGAGIRLSQGRWDGRIKALFYVRVAILQTAATLIIIFITSGMIPLLGLALVLVIFLAWPLTVLFLMSRRDVTEMYRDALDGMESVSSRNYGIQGAAALMLALGVIGSGFSVLILYLLLTLGNQRSLAGILFMIGAITLTVRSIMHVFAGFGALGSVGSVGFLNHVRRYHLAALISVGVVCLAIVFDEFHPSMIPMLVAIAGMLMIWPLVMNNFAGHVTLKVALEDDQTLHSPSTLPLARDGGLTALGFVLLFFGGMRLAEWLSTLVQSHTFGLGELMFGSTSLPSWVLPIQSAILLWAGVELALMTTRFKIAGNIYGVIGTGLGLWGGFGVFKMAASSMMGYGMNPFSNVMPIIAIVMQVTIPIMVLIMVNRLRVAKPIDTEVFV